METNFREKNGFFKWLWVSIKGLWVGSVPGDLSAKLCTSDFPPFVNKLISLKVDFRPVTDPSYGP